MGKIPYFGVFPTFWWYDLSNDFILKFSKLILNGKQNLVQALYLEIKLWPHNGKTLESQLLKNFFETQDLMGNPNCCFVIIAVAFFFLQPISEGNCDLDTI